MLKFYIFQHFQNKVAEIRGETKFWGRWVWIHINPSPPQSKFGGGAFAGPENGIGSYAAQEAGVSLADADKPSVPHLLLLSCYRMSLEITFEMLRT